MIKINVKKKEGQTVIRTRIGDFLENDQNVGVGSVAVLSKFPSYPF